MGPPQSPYILVQPGLIWFRPAAFEHVLSPTAVVDFMLSLRATPKRTRFQAHSGCHTRDWTLTGLRDIVVMVLLILCYKL